MIPIPYQLIIKKPSFRYLIKHFEKGYMWEGLMLDSTLVKLDWWTMNDVTGMVMVVFSEGCGN